MTQAHASDRSEGEAVYETEAATATVRSRQAENDRSVLEYAVETDHPAPVRVRIRQRIPDSASIDDLGFPGKCADDWERDGDALLFEREVTPGTTARTAWGVDGELGEDLEPPTFDADPVSLELDDEFEIDEEVLDGPDDEAAESSEPDGTTDEADDAVEDGDGPVLDLDLDDPQADVGDDSASTSPDGASDSEEGTSVLESPAALDDLATEPSDAAEGSLAAVDDDRTTDDADGGTSGATDDAPESTTDDSSAGEPASDEDATDAQGPNEGDGNRAADADDSGEATRDTEAPDSVVLQLVEELHGEELDDSHRAALADALEVRLSDSTNAFVEHVRERQRRRAERIEDELEALEESVDGLYGLKADANEVATLKRAITRLDDAKASDADLRELRTRVQDLAEASADREGLDALREDHESLAASLEATDEELSALEAEAQSAREAIGDEVRAVAEDLGDLDERAATGDELDAVADDLATLRDAAATEAALDDLDDAVAELEDDAATESELADLRSELESVEARLAERVDLLADRHDELAAESATDEAMESLRDDHRKRLNETTSELQALRETLEDEYTSDEEIGEALDRRVHRSLTHLVAFAIGAVGLVSTLPLAIAGSPAAAVTFLGGAGVLGAWWHAVGRAGIDDEGGRSLRDLLP